MFKIWKLLQCNWWLQLSGSTILVIMQKNILKLCKFISKDYIIKNEINKVLGTNNIQECRWFIEMDE